MLRMLLRVYRKYIWLPDPFAHNHLLDEALAGCGEADLVVAAGDFSCDSAFVGVCDDAACESARTVLNRLRSRFGEAFIPVLGDHELGKLSLFGAKGGFRVASWRRATGELAISGFWQRRLGRRWVAMGLASSLWAFPAYESEALPEERPEWWRLRAEHVEGVRRAFEALGPEDQVILFVHDPTALPFVAAEPGLKRRLGQVRATVVGHLHSPLILRISQMLAGMPKISFLGNAIRRMTGALNRARAWRQFRLILCPSLTGIELLKDGGWLELELDPEGLGAVRIGRRRLPR